MRNFNTVAAEINVTRSRPGMMIAENYAALLAAGLDDVMREDMARPTEGGQFFRPVNMTKATLVTQKTFGMGPAKQNRDSDELPISEGGLGFPWTLESATFRQSCAIEKNLLENELYDEVKRRQTDLVESMRLSKELIMADVFNRALGDATTGAPVLAEDGLYLLDSARPSAYGPAGDWSNLEGASAITPTAFNTARLAFASNVDSRGQRAPLTLKRVIIRPEDETATWEIIKSELRPTDAQNAANFWKGRLEYTVFNMLTSAVIFYLADDPKSTKNELVWGTRIAPSVEQVDIGNNDVIVHRIRARHGPGLGRPTIWRGGPVS